MHADAQRPYEPFAYSDAPLRDAFWPGTVPVGPEVPSLHGSHTFDAVVIGGGFAGLAAALRLSDAGLSVAVLDARVPGWGASGRNGGLVSVGSAKLADGVIESRVGIDDARCFYAAEHAAINAVHDRIERYALDVDLHSEGYTLAAHHPRAVAELHAYGATYRRRYGLDYRFLDRDAMRAEGLDSPAFCAAVQLPLGCALNPMKMHRGLLEAAVQAGVAVFAHSEVVSVETGFTVRTAEGVVNAPKLLLATNGYLSDALPGHRHRILPVQSNILVSRPLSEAEIAAQGWHSAQMVVDSRRLLHYFRLMPDRRLLLGLRGTVRASPAAFAATRDRARADFEWMFPAWRHVETPHFWSGLIAMSRELMPIAGPVPGQPGAWMTAAYHGSGVAMAPYCGELIADLALGKQRLPHPAFMQRTPRRFELGRFRRAVLPAVFAAYGVLDRFGR
ncbi:MAG: FAD-dependent oxidoreductase [Pseudomonadota bacterium]